MKILCQPKPGVLELKDNFPVPVRHSDTAVIKMERCGICGSDITAYRGTNPTMRYPINGLGHEGVGVIEDIAEDNAKGLKIGDRVALEPYVPCNKCHMCKAGRFNNCADIQVCGVHKDGMMAEYFEHPVQLIYKLPDELSWEHAALVEPLTIGLHAAARARVSAGEHVVIFGAGIIGLLAAFGCINYGATPILVDVLQKRLDYAKELGIPYIFNSSNGGVQDFLQKVTNKKMPEAMIDCTGAPSVLENMHDYVCHGARIALVGWPHAPVSINTVRCMQKELDICPSRNSNGKFPEAIRLITERKVPTDAIITKLIDMEQVDETIQDMIRNPSNYMKVIVKI